MMRCLFLLCAFTLWAVAPVQAEIVGKEITYQANGTNLKGYLAYDSSIKGKRPGVLVVHEWWGHNDYARKRARMLAKMGYVALAVDMYGDGKQAAHPEDAQKFSSAIANNLPLAKQRFQAAVTLLKNDPATEGSDIAAIGYCFGGAVVLQMAREGMDLDAVASFHGSLGTARPAKPGATKAKVLVAHGGADPFVKPEEITGFIDEMNKAGISYRFLIYGGALHSFTNPDADKFGAKFQLPLKYNAEADQESWQAMGDFLKEAFAD